MSTRVYAYKCETLEDLERKAITCQGSILGCGYKVFMKNVCILFEVVFLVLELMCTLKQCLNLELCVCRESKCGAEV